MLALLGPPLFSLADMLFVSFCILALGLVFGYLFRFIQEG